MLSWFKRREPPRQPAPNNNTKEILDAAVSALNRLGELVEKHPGYMDENWLPLPKPDMKTALKILWVASGNNIESRNLVEVGWSFLSSFQPGVGEVPISPIMPQNISPEEYMAKIEPFLRFSKLWETETQANKVEFAEFVRSQK